MRSTVQIKGHPVHAMLIAFPVAFLVGACVFDLGGLLLERPTMWATGSMLSIAGVVTGLLAGAAGFIDYLYTVPPKSSGKRRATTHMMLNVSAMSFFLIAWLLRDGGLVPPPVVTYILEIGGTAVLLSGAWLGGTLVYRNQIGVDHRYADAGKWSEATVDTGGEWVVVARSDELQNGQMKLLRLGDLRIVLARTAEGYAAFDDHCTHRGGSLAGGVLVGCTVSCPWHGSQFDVNTGEVKSGPAKEPISCYELEDSGGLVRLRVPAHASAAHGSERIESTYHH
jgi:nitrite reductase/ring-hydroxylating ferredoxin subunit/uncharacterized membrane protein